MTKIHPVNSLEDTRNLAETLASSIKCGDVVTLAGDLGTGKTTFAQFFIQALSSGPVEVTSPTFTLLQTYPILLADKTRSELYHYDLYRIEHPAALVELGLEDALSHVTLIEWPEHLYGTKLPIRYALHFTLEPGGARKIGVSSPT